MAQTQSSSSTHSPSSANKWLIALAVMIATIIEVLDMTIANVALDHIRGSLSAGVDEAAWVLTSYIVGNAIVIPLTGWLGSVFGRKRFFKNARLIGKAVYQPCVLEQRLSHNPSFRWRCVPCPVRDGA